MAIYLDHAATTPLRREALEAMLPYLGPTFGNPSSAHAFGRAARNALDEAHERLAAALGATAREIVFTSGGTEANNLALKGAAWAGKARGHRIVTTAVEHHAVGHALRHLEKFGFEVVEVARRPVRAGGPRRGRGGDRRPHASSCRSCSPTTRSARSSRSPRSPSASGATGASSSTSTRSRLRRGWTSTSRALGADLVALGAHKFEGPKGVGRALDPPRDPAPAPSSTAGARSATGGRARRTWPARSGWPSPTSLPVPGSRLPGPAVTALRDRLAAACLAVAGVELTGHPAERLPGLLSLVVRGADGVAMAVALDLEGIAASTGSACATGVAGAEPRPHRDGLPGRRGGAARCASRSAGRRRRPRSTRPARSSRASSPRCGTAGLPGRPTRPAPASAGEGAAVRARPRGPRGIGR